MRRAILLFGRVRDPHIAAVRRELKDRGTPTESFDPYSYPRRESINLLLENGAPGPSIAGVDLQTVGAGWIGSSLSVHVTSAIDAKARRFAVAAARQGLDSFLRATTFPWINDPDAAAIADDKYHQLVTASRLGFEVPRTLVTNDPAAFRRFRRKRALIAKSISGSDGLPSSRRILTNPVEPNDLLRADSIRYAPVMFQDYVPKSSELRVTVIGQEVFPVRIHSQQHEATRTDWRRYVPGMKYSKAVLPATFRGKCVRLAKRLGLDYAGIDVIERPDGRLVFLEINSLPAWLWLEEATGVPLTSKLVDLLESRREATRVIARAERARRYSAGRRPRRSSVG